MFSKPKPCPCGFSQIDLPAGADTTPAPEPTPDYDDSYEDDLVDASQATALYEEPPREQGPRAMEVPQTQSNWLYVRETTQAPSTPTLLPVLYGPGETQTTTPPLRRVCM